MKKIKKYKLIKEMIEYDCRILYRIVACKNFLLKNGMKIKKGDLGGYVECYNNLSQDGNCWIFGGAKVMDHATVLDDAMVYDNATIKGNALVMGNAIVTWKSTVMDYARIMCDAYLIGPTVMDHVIVMDNCLICGDDILLNGNKIVNEKNATIERCNVNDNGLIKNEFLLNKNKIVCWYRSSLN